MAHVPALRRDEPQSDPNAGQAGVK